MSCSVIEKFPMRLVRPTKSVGGSPADRLKTRGRLRASRLFSGRFPPCAAVMVRRHLPGADGAHVFPSLKAGAPLEGETARG